MDENGRANGETPHPAQRKVISSYKDLIVWQLGMDLAVACYHLARLLPKDEMFGLSSQLQTCSIRRSRRISPKDMDVRIAASTFISCTLRRDH